jgi:hypothetical protein
VTLYDCTQRGSCQPGNFEKGQAQEIEIRKGNYKAEILQAGKRVVSTVSFIGNTGVLEF